MRLDDFFKLFKKTFRAWSRRNTSLLAAALAYYAVFSIAPLILLSVSMIGIIFEKETARQEALSYVSDYLGPKAAETIKVIMGNIGPDGSGIITTIIGFAILIWAATGIFFNARRAMNVIWNYTPKSGGGILTMLKNRLISFLLVMGVGFLLLVSVLVSTLIPPIASSLAGLLPSDIYLIQGINFLLSIIGVTILFSILYVVLPGEHVTFKDVWQGAAITSVLFNIGTLVIGLYVSNSGIVSIYGAAGSLVLILIWVYYTTQVFLLGAEFTRAYAVTYGSKKPPKKDINNVTRKVSN